MKININKYDKKQKFICLDPNIDIWAKANRLFNEDNHNHMKKNWT
jgi:hypothetical protein